MNIALILTSIVGVISSINIIMSFIEKIKKPVDKIADKKIKEVLEPINIELKNIRQDVIRIDKNECKNYLTEFLEDIKKGIEKTDIEKQRATEVYDHYTNDLHLNSYIHTEWEKLMK